MIKSRTVFLCGLLLLCGQPVKAQTASVQATEAVSDELVESVVVQAARRERLLTYIKSVSTLSSDGQISRRSNRLCPLVAGAPAEVNTYVTARLREVGREVGVQFEQKMCQPNLLVLFSREPEAMLRQARERRKINFEPASPIQIQRFLDDRRPVRWWHSVVFIPALGAFALDGDIEGAGQSVRAGGSNIVSATRSVIRGSLIVVDASQTDGVEIGALADYLTLVALSDIKPDVDLSGYASILNLFSTAASDDDASSRLTAMDMAYLRGVYGARDTSYGMNQIGKVATIMDQELGR